ncbi:hypothetical protein HPP92_002973 [Vanilla planifolia]|uniref:CSC1/OSCA1-like N-terminal transmembrane domain-containing protein n=1 Tax=Vanilla planifolia TaxID=51239 RepID=A0A835VN79_VANPL|nr:hypothetical protein HPP92_002973 [Vanilla planifolia]
MASLEDLAVSAFINILSAIGFLLAFAVLRVQPINARVYYPKLFISGLTSSTRGSSKGVLRFVNFNLWSYVVSFFSWMPEALKKSQTEIIEHAGLDSAIYLRIYVLGLKIFVPLTVSALLVIIPVNVSGGTLLSLKKDVFFNDIDKLSISNISDGSERFWVHLVMAYLFTIWTCYILYMEYCNVAFMRLHFLATQHTAVLSNSLWLSKYSQYFQGIQSQRVWTISFRRIILNTTLVTRLFTMQTDLLSLLGRRKGYKIGWTITSSNLKGIQPKNQLERLVSWPLWPNN